MPNEIGELQELVTEVRQGVTTIKQEHAARIARLERQARANDGLGFLPNDQVFAADDRLSAIRALTGGGGHELAARDSYADWLADQGKGRRLEPGEFRLGRLVQAMISGERGTLTDVERQALSEGTDASGGVFVQDQVAAGVLDLVRARTAVIEAGATTVPMSSDTMVWPRVLTGATPEWKAELAPMGESVLTFGAMTLVACTLRTTIKLSEELSEDISPAGADAIERELQAAFALEVDRAALVGSGVAPIPLGIKGTPGVITYPAIGTPTNFAFLSTAIHAIRAENHEPTAAILSATTAGTLDALQALDDQPLRPPPSVAALRTIVTNLASGDAFVGEWPLLVIGFRPQVGVRIKRVDAGLKDDFSISIVAWLRCDVGVVDPKAFAVASGITA